MGESVGRCHQISQNNNGTLYTAGSSAQGVHMALTGDPALRLHILAPITNLTLSGTTLAWTASPDATLGYHIYRASSASGPFTRLTVNPIAATTYTDAGGGSSFTYMVRAIALTTSNTGTYQNASQGVFTEAAPVATRVSLGPLHPRIHIGETRTFTATVLDQNGAPLSPQPAVTWSASSGSISSGGVFTPHAAHGTCTVTATSGGVATSTTVTVLPAVGSGTGISREFWSNLAGSTVADLTGAAAYPASPTSTSTLTDLCETPLGLGINFGQRLQGFFIPPVTGSYCFHINSNASSELWLSTDESSANATKIASVSGWTYRQQWDKYASQKSAAIPLTAGQRVFYRVLHKAGSYGYHQTGIGVEYPGGVMERPAPAHRFDRIDTTPLQHWRMVHFGTTANTGDAADTADPDADGFANLVEYALDTTPDSSASHPVVESGISNLHLQLTFTPQRVSGLIYTIEASDDLSDWSDRTDVTGLLTPGTPFTHTDPASAATRRFLRLHISQP
jgi:hypothetical protein